MTKGGGLEAGVGVGGGTNGRRGGGSGEEGCFCWPYLGVGVSWSGRGLVWAWRRGVGVCVLLVAASFSLFLVTSSSKRAGGLYTRVIFTFNNAPGYIMDIMVPSHNASKSSSSSSTMQLSSSSSSPLDGGGGGGGEDEDEEDADGDSDGEGESQGKGGEGDNKGFLVHTSGCIIPDFDPFHHTVTRFISNPLNLTCKHPPALTTANGTTLYYHHHVLREHLESFLKVYEQRLKAASIAAAVSAAASNSNSSSNSTAIPSNGTSFPFSPDSFRKFFLSATPPLAASSASRSNERSSSDDMTIYFDFSVSNSSAEDKASSASFSSSSTSAAGERPMEGLSPSLDPTSGIPKVKCCYRAIYRVEQKPKAYNAAADGRWRYSGQCTPLDGPTTPIHEESILVYCNMSSVVIYKNVHYFIQRHKVLKPSLPETPMSGVVSSKYAVGEKKSNSNNNQNVYITTSSVVNNKEPDSYSSVVQKKNALGWKSHRSRVTSTANTNTKTSTTTTNNDPSGFDAVGRGEKLSVIIFGTDSASRLNMRRHLPKTYQYLMETLGAVDLTGFNKVGDNTFPNLVPITIGLSHHELANHSCVPNKEKFDDCPWIWRDFKKNGYVTAFIEDSPWMGMYNYMHNGFVKQPTDFYGRAFFLASEKEIGNEKHGNSNVCQGDKLSLKVVQDYSLELARTFFDHPTFSLYWSASVSHDYLNLLRHADLPHLDYLQQLKEMGALNHTALFFISDHGMRWGSIRSTYVGMLEERLPYVLVYLPPWFREKYKTAFRNLKRNARRLTANFDLYETLYDLAHGRFAVQAHVASRPSHKTRGISLFKAIPVRRRCDDAGIPEHFCTCQETKDIPLTDPVLDMAAAYLKGFLNKELMPYPQCVRFNKIDLLTCRVSGSNKQLSPQDATSDVRSYLLQGRLTPGDVHVEATLRYNPQPQVFQLTGEVSRINVYGNTSHCIRHMTLRKFCFCKDSLNLDDKTEQHQNTTQQQKNATHQQQQHQQQQEQNPQSQQQQQQLQTPQNKLQQQEQTPKSQQQQQQTPKRSQQTEPLITVQPAPGVGKTTTVAAEAPRIPEVTNTKKSRSSSSSRETATKETQQVIT